MRKAIIIFALSLLFVLTIEVCARMDEKIRYRAPFFGDYSPALLRRKDPEGINCNVPNSQFEKWKINRFGFRGEDITPIKPKGVIRIICMGTSETFGLYESPGQEWPNQLNNVLDGYNHFEIINSSVVGLPLRKFRHYIEKYVLKLEPNIVILYVNPFDYGVGAEKFALQQNLPQKRTNGLHKTKMEFLKDIPSSFRMFPKFKQAVKRIVPENVLKSYQLWNLKRQLHNLEHTRLNGNKPIESISTENLDSFQRDLEELIQFLHNEKIGVILCSYPILITLENINDHLEIFLDHRRFYVELSLRGIIDASNKFNNIMSAVAEKNRVVFIDINGTIPKNINYFADNVHYTDVGARFVALKFSDYIREHWPD